MNVDESMLDVYIYETQQLLEALENTLFAGENDKKLNSEQINEVFRIMHTIKGASAMMEFEPMARLSHSLEDMFALIRENATGSYDWPAIFDIMFSAISFFNGELAKLLDKQPIDGDSSEIIARLKVIVAKMKGEPAAAAPAAQAVPTPEPTPVAAPAAPAAPTPEAPAVVLEAPPPAVVQPAPQAPVVTVPKVQEEQPVAFEHKGDEAYYKVKLYFEENSQMENIRAFGVVQSIKNISVRYAHIPVDLNGEAAMDEIRSNGFLMFLQSGDNPDNIKALLEATLFLKSVSILPIEGDDEEIPASIRLVRETVVQEVVQETVRTKAVAQDQPAAAGGDTGMGSVAKQNFISVNVNKLDSLLNIVGEIVTAQSMVINNADFGDRQHDNFDSAAQQLHSLINELQDIVMTIRMIPVSTLFQKMRRLVRDMSKKFNKSIELEIIGEETEVDKNVIDSLADPLMHIIRNSVDHGVEDPETRVKQGKPPVGKITLEARMTGSDVIVTIVDDGGGLSREKILKKASDKGLLTKPEAEMTDKEVYALIFLPGFSTKEQVTEFSGRGVGMDVVRKNIGSIGGSVTVDSTPGVGTTHTIRIPLTLTIVDGMKFNVGKMNFIVPTVSVRSAVKPDVKDIFTDPEGNEMIMLLGNVYGLVRLSRFFNIDDAIQDLSEGMIMHIASEEKEFCIFFDHLDGEYQVVVKKLPNYLKNCSSSLDGVGGCAILGDGSINLIIDVNSLQ